MNENDAAGDLTSPKKGPTIQREPNDASRIPSPSRPFVLGVVGDVAGGKSAFARALGRLGAQVADADRLGHLALDRSDVRDRLVEAFGDAILEPASGRIDRSRMAGIVFTDETALRHLETVLHPVIKEMVEDVRRLAEKEGAGLVVVDAPLLLEAGWDDECDAVVYVESNRDSRLERVKARGWSSEQLARREARQWSAKRKKRASDRIIANLGSIADLEMAAETLLSNLSNLAQGRDERRGSSVTTRKTPTPIDAKPAT